MNYSNSQRAGVILYLTALIFGAYDNYVDMRRVMYWEVNDGLQLYFEDGSGYYIAGGID